MSITEILLSILGFIARIPIADVGKGIRNAAIRLLQVHAFAMTRTATRQILSTGFILPLFSARRSIAIGNFDPPIYQTNGNPSAAAEMCEMRLDADC
ncbi:MAG: hypothetical protein ONA90_02670 [candidate division KSB1 bacterium]|nr:hypothetical protein [candidate division KSB1 bacterium]